jgi:hypothetical protein
LTKALDFFRSAAKQGCAETQYNFGLCCDNGYGVNNDEFEVKNGISKRLNRDMTSANKILKNSFKYDFELSMIIAEFGLLFVYAAANNDSMDYNDEKNDKTLLNRKPSIIKHGLINEEKINCVIC